FKARLRLWNPVTGEALQRSGAFDTDPRGRPDGRRPALAAWRTGPGERDVAVAVGGRGQPVRVGDGAARQRRTVGGAAVGAFERPRAFLPDSSGGTLVSGFVSGGGKLGRWLVRGKDLPVSDGTPEPIHAEGGCAALTALPGQRGTPAALAGVVYFPKEGE